MELNYLQAFYHVAKEGSFTEAARKLRISQPSLSKAVGLLEAREGVKLLHRTKTGVSLTEVGEKVFAKCETIFHSVDEIRSYCRGTSGKLEGPMRFGVSDHIGNYFIPSAMIALRKEHPGVVPSVFTGTPHDIISRLLRRELEFGLFFTKINMTGIEYRAIGKAEFVAVRSTKSSSSEIEWIGSIRRDYTKHPTETLLRKARAEHEIAFESNSQELQKKLCLAGSGLAVLARFMVSDELNSGKLQKVAGYKPMSADLFLVTRKGHELSPLALQFLEKFRPEWARGTGKVVYSLPPAAKHKNAR